MEHIRPLFDSYTEVFEAFGEDKITERYKTLVETVEDFIKNSELEGSVFLDREILSHMIFDYLSDVMRIKGFHDITHINEVKIQSYELQWFLRRKPLQNIKAATYTERILYVNEAFALSRIYHTLCAEGGFDSNTFKNDALQYFTSTVSYYLKFRHCNAQSLELMMTAFLAGFKCSHI